MVFSDTTNKNGIIQRIERRTGLGDGAISGDSTALKIFTADVNDAFDELMPLLLSYSDKGRFDDTNNNDFPIWKENLVSGTNNYAAKVDGDSLDILRVTDVQILPSATATNYITLTKISGQNENALDAMAPASTDTGVPSFWLARDGVVFLNPNPNYSATNGVKLFYERIQSYFVSTDTTKAPGIPRIFHPLLPKIVSRNWLGENKPSNTSALVELKEEIMADKQALSDMMSKRNPFQARMSVSTTPVPGRNQQQTDSNR